VPSDDASLPQPRLANGDVDPRFAITEEKRFLGKQLFFDPVRTNRIHPEFGGDLSTAQTGSCGSCHSGEVAGKAGQTINLSLGGVGRGFVNTHGELVFDRRVRSGLVDTIPTPLDIFANGTLVQSGRFDAVDSVPRLSPSMIGFAFNTRLLLGGKAGQHPGEGPGAANPLDLPTGENLAEIAFDAHRMLETQKDAIQAVPAYVAAFRAAFPEEAAQADASGNLDDLIDDHTIARAVATFLRTVVTRNTAFDRFLAGDDAALTAAQRRGAKLFFTPATDGGAGCVSCHSGPMLNKQLGDEEGLLVEENFVNVGVGDHPLQELGREALGDPSHHDVGRGEITGNHADDFEFRTLTLRQLKDGRQFMHSALFTSVRQVVEYFDAGVPQDEAAIAAGNVSERFTHPRGPGSAPGLGLTERQIDDLVDFLENALDDPAFVTATPGSSTRAFELGGSDLQYSQFHPDLAALGARDGFTLGNKAPSDDDPVSRLDRGLDLAEVSDPMAVSHDGSDEGPDSRVDHYSMTNFGTDSIRMPLTVVVDGLPAGVTLEGADGTTESTPAPGLPYRRITLDSGYMTNGETISIDLSLAHTGGQPFHYSIRLFSGAKRP
jgi:cytochrome c peroxidase